MPSAMAAMPGRTGRITSRPQTKLATAARLARGGRGGGSGSSGGSEPKVRKPVMGDLASLRGARRPRAGGGVLERPDAGGGVGEELARLVAAERADPAVAEQRVHRAAAVM